MRKIIIDDVVYICPFDCEDITADTPRVQFRRGVGIFELVHMGAFLTAEAARAWRDALDTAMVEMENVL